MSKRKKYPDWQHGDRKDAKRLRNLDSMHVFMPYLLPNRADNEAVLEEEIDLTAVENYINRKNSENPEFKYTLFHIICAALAKTIELCPKMNYFIAGCRMYERRDISFSFVVKKEFVESAEESLAILKMDRDSEETTLEQFRSKLYKIIYSVRKLDQTDGTTAIIDILQKLPRPVLKLAMATLNFWSYHGILPDALANEDPYSSSVFISNLGSIKMNANYHHLVNWSTNSLFVIIGERHLKPFFNADGSYELRPAVNLGLTVDERIADGLYFGRSVKLLRHLLNNPELLEMPMKEPVEWTEL